MHAPSHERACHLDLLAWQAALEAAAASRNGHRLPPDVQWLVAHRALAAPVTAARCPAVLAALPPDAREAVLAAALRVTPLAGQASQPAGSGHGTGPASAASGWLTTAQAAAVAQIGAHGIRAACRRGTLPASRDRVTGQWRIRATDAGEYARRRHGRQDTR